MREFFRDCKGAVTVFITLLIIPALLVTGSGVDLTRIYTARSAVRNANQLAANSAMAGYDAVLKDLYGLYAVMQSDAELAEMLDTYVRATLFGEEITEARMGELRLFWGTESYSLAIRGFDDLDNTDILRRQIEEYAKWRAPVAIISDILGRLDRDGDTFDQISADSEVIRDKTEIDGYLEDILNKYRELYDEINNINADYLRDEAAAFNGVNASISRLRSQLRDLYELREEYEHPSAATVREQFLIEHYTAIVRNISSIVNGGPVGFNWENIEYTDAAGQLRFGRFKNSYTENPGYRNTITGYVNKFYTYGARFDRIIDLAAYIDNSANRLRMAIEHLEAKLVSNGGYSEGLAEGVQRELDDYKKLLLFDFLPLCRRYKDDNMAVINDTVSILQRIDGYGKVSGNALTAPQISFANLSRLDSINGFQPDFNVNASLYPARTDLFDRIYNLTSFSFSAPGVFRSFSTRSGTHASAYVFLEKTLGYKTTPAQAQEAGKKEQELFGAFDAIMTVYNALLNYDVSPGAKEYSPAAGNKPGSFGGNAGPTLYLGLDGFGEGFFGFLGTVVNLLSGSQDIKDVLNDALNDLANRALLVTYCNNMFSNFTTEPGSVSMRGLPISPEINYFYKSELEYLYNGSSRAVDNLLMVSLTIFGIRILANAVSSYIISDINSEILFISGLVALIPVAGTALRFLVRPLYVVGESISDLGRLRKGCDVVLMKLRPDTWKFSLQTLLSAGNSENDEFGINYRDYLTIFLLAGDQSTIASRTGDLIMLNVTNYNNGNSLNADYARMSEMRLFDLAGANTGFEVTTTINMRFMFLSLPYAQNGSRVSVVPRKTFPVSQTDYRGY